MPWAGNQWSYFYVWALITPLETKSENDVFFKLYSYALCQEEVRVLLYQ